MSLRLLVTGASGFIGREAVSYFKGSRGWEVFGIDSLVKPGSTPNKTCDRFWRADVRRIEELPIPRVDAVLHLAAQTAVTISVDQPVADFQANAEATMRLALWCFRHGSTLLYASSNKVYGDLKGIREPISRAQPLDPKTPYGISKATGALYVRELCAESYVFHQSCIYGQRQQGTEDQGWIAYLAKRGRQGKPVICYGSGEQVRDLLHVSDLVRLYEQAIDRRIQPGSYVVGGGEHNAFSFLEAADMLGVRIDYKTSWRPHDQHYFVSANDGLGEWKPEVKFEVARLDLL